MPSSEKSEHEESNVKEPSLSIRVIPAKCTNDELAKTIK